MNTIFFIGLFLFMNATTSDSSVHVVIPPITSGGAVQPHTLIFMYPAGTTAAFLGNWGTTQPVQLDAWYYVELNKDKPGDRVSFQAPQTNQLAAVPAELAHLQKKCTKFSNLSQGFGGPAFAGAPAVVDVPYGTLTEVTAQSADGTNWRMDTRLTYTSNGPLIMTIVNGLSVRSLVLPQGTCGILGYIPTAALHGPMDMTPVNAPDVTAFFNMMQSNPNVNSIECTSARNETSRVMNGSGCQPKTEPWVPRPATSKTMSNTARASTTPRAQTARPVVAEGPSCPLPFRPPNSPCPAPNYFMNADCSNTQWP